MLTKDLLRRGASLLAALAMASTLAPRALAENAKLEQPALNPRVKTIIEADGYQFIDLNGNGTLDAYEDWRLDADTRAADLVSQMTVREKIAQMQHPHLSAPFGRQDCAVSEKILLRLRHRHAADPRAEQRADRR